MTESDRLLFRAPLSEDLRTLSVVLRGSGLAHRIVEENGEQVVFLGPGVDPVRAQEVLGNWQRGAYRVQMRRLAGGSGATPGFTAILGAAPVTLSLILLSVVGFLLLYLAAPVEWIALLTFKPFTLQAGRPVFTDSAQLWRFITPVFLHFGWMHIVFNSLWCWELGRRIEGLLGSFNLLLLFLVVAAVSNGAQDAVSGGVLFGGLSGVVYGFLGFAWTAGRLNPRWRALAPANPIMLFMVGWLVICMVGVIDVLGFSIANAAHLGGLLCGGVIGAVFGLGFRGRA